MHRFNKEMLELCHTDAGYVHLHCMNYYQDAFEAKHHHSCTVEENCFEAESPSLSVSVVIIGIIAILVVFCIILLIYELFKYRARRILENSQRVLRAQQHLHRRHGQVRVRRTLQEGPMPYGDCVPPNYDDLCMSESELPTFEEAISSPDN